MKEADVLELLRQKYTRVRRGTSADRYVRAAHVRYPATWGFGFADRIADYIVLDTYEQGQMIGFEVKVSRSDWLHELAQADKAEVWKRHCNAWYLVASDRNILRNRDELPDGWGFMAPDKTGQLRVIDRAPHNPEPNPVPLAVLTYLGRAIQKTAERDKETNHDQQC